MFARKSQIHLNCLVLALLCVASIFATRSDAATFTVLNANNTGAGSLRQAIMDSNSAPGNDTIVFDAAVFSTPQTITLVTQLFVAPGSGNSLTITGPGESLLTISGGGTVTIFGRDPNFGHTLAISGMTLTNANGSAVGNSSPNHTLNVTNVTFNANANSFGGGAISNAGVLTVTNSTFTNNVTATGGGTGSNGGGAIQSSTNNVNIPVTITGSTFIGNTANSTFAGSGGAVQNRSGAMTITDSTFTNNAALEDGGAISNGGVLSISGSTFIGNSATSGAGGAISSVTSAPGQLTITGSIFNGNSATADGGGIVVGFSATTTITNSTFSNNTSNSDNNTTGDGGGIYIRGDAGAVSITGSTINGNTATGTAGDGGGIFNANALNLTNSTVSGNTAGSTGGGIYAEGGGTAVVTIESSTIVGNSAAVTGGGVRRASSSNPVNLHNSIFANNTDNGTAPNIQGTVVSQGYNLIEDTTGAVIGGNLTGNITGQDPNLGPLTDNMGPTFTHALLFGSPAVDAADPIVFPATDQRGVARPLNGDAIAGALSDIGSFEMVLPTAAPVTISGFVRVNKRGLRGATVILSDLAGNQISTETSSAGRFSFTDLDSGQTYIVYVTSRNYDFEPQTVTAEDNVENILFEITPGRGPGKPEKP